MVEQCLTFEEYRSENYLHFHCTKIPEHGGKM